MTNGPGEVGNNQKRQEKGYRKKNKGRSSTGGPVANYNGQRERFKI